jgi:lipopolysaccharide export system permease protein
MRTLQRYITMDLVKSATMGTVAFTLLMSIIGIIEPLREQGLAAKELIAVIAMTSVLMLSLCLPMAMLFAATIVYGRFAQDNELTACRASGISTIATLRPGLYCAGVVTAVTLLVSNFVVPYIASHATEALYSNIKGMAFATLNRKGVISTKDYVIRVDYADVSTDTLYGVVVIPKPKPEKREKPSDPDPTPPAPEIVITAAEARVLGFTRTADNDVYVKLDIIEPRAIVPNIQARQFRGIGEYGPLPNPFESEMKLAGWATLLGIARDPITSPEINKQLKEYHRDIGQELFIRDVVDTIKAGQRYTKLKTVPSIAGLQTTFDLSAPKAYGEGLGAVILESVVRADGTEVPVEVLINDSEGGRKRLTARRCRIDVSWSAFQNKLLVTISPETVEGQDLSAGSSADPMRVEEWVKGELPLPPSVAERQAAITLRQLYDNPEKYTRDPSVKRGIKYLRDKRVPKVRGKAQAEMHSRLFYSCSCFFVVALGAALGMIFRGGQVISAFVLSLIPFVSVVLLLSAGRNMIKSEDVGVAVGIAIIWGGLAALAAGTAAAYGYLSRQ